MLDGGYGVAASVLCVFFCLFVLFKAYQETVQLPRQCSVTIHSVRFGFVVGDVLGSQPHLPRVVALEVVLIDFH